ncbi:MAG: type II toxin-antitoxin system RelE/ParE family toxin [Chloroflexi bacterium]|nr:type II toxin-antitoxin system RelE/ParE family toxin [Chloroflexota bacterium]
MASVVVTPTARRNLADLIETHSLPASTTERLRRALEPLGEFPALGAPLEGRWAGFRFVLGPWRWMIVVCRFDEAIDQVAVVTIRDGRSARAPKTAR